MISVSGEYFNRPITRILSARDCSCYSNEIRLELNSMKVNKFRNPEGIKPKSYMSFKPSGTHTFIKMPHDINVLKLFCNEITSVHLKPIRFLREPRENRRRFVNKSSTHSEFHTILNVTGTFVLGIQFLKTVKTNKIVRVLCERTR